MKSFASDNYSGVHPDIMRVLLKANSEHAVAYGDDHFTAHAENLFKQQFGAKSQSFFVFNGTAANVLSIALCIRPHQAVLCTDTAHINVDECGAPERFTSGKLLTHQSKDGKIDLDLFATALQAIGNQHNVQPKIISISQTTELGTVYSLEELNKVAQFAKSNQLYVHLDGARLSNAAASLNCSLADIAEASGADILSFGGTKNGLMYGEAVVILNPDIALDFVFLRKQAMQLSSKMRFVSAQFIAYLQNDQWRQTANHANEMAGYLEKKLLSIPEIEITQLVQANAVFAKVPNKIIKPLQQKYPFYVWNQANNEVRWMCSWDTTVQDVSNFVYEINNLLK